MPFKNTSRELKVPSARTPLLTSPLCPYQFPPHENVNNPHTTKDLIICVYAAYCHQKQAKRNMSDLSLFFNCLLFFFFLDVVSQCRSWVNSETSTTDFLHPCVYRPKMHNLVTCLIAQCSWFLSLQCCQTRKQKYLHFQLSAISQGKLSSIQCCDTGGCFWGVGGPISSGLR